MKTVSGVGKDEPRVTNERGGTQSQVPYRFDLLDAPAMFKMTEVLKEGADKYGVNNWHKISVQDHLNHLIIHAYAYLAGDVSDDHLSHLMCRAMFAQAVDIMDKKDAHTDKFVEVGTVIKCGKCRSDITIEGVQGYGLYSCENCGTGNEVTIVDGMVSIVRPKEKSTIITIDTYVDCGGCSNKLLVLKDATRVFCRNCQTGHSVKNVLGNIVAIPDQNLDQRSL